MSSLVEQTEAIFQRACRAAHEAVGQSLLAALRQARKRLLEQNLQQDAALLENAALSTLESLAPETGRTRNRGAHMALAVMLERLRSEINPVLQRLGELAASIDPDRSKALVDALRPGQCVRRLAALTTDLSLSDQGWLVTAKIAERRLLSDLPVVISNLRAQLQPVLLQRGAPQPFVLKTRIAPTPPPSDKTAPDDTTLVDTMRAMQVEVNDGQLRAKDLRALRLILMTRLAQRMACQADDVSLEPNQEAALDGALSMVQPVLTESARLPAAFSALFRGLFLIVAQDYLLKSDDLYRANAPWHWLLDEMRLALRDGGARTHWATRATCTLLASSEPDTALLKQLLDTAPNRPTPDTQAPAHDHATTLGAKTLQTVLHWLRSNETLPPHARQMLRRSWSRVLLDLGERHGSDSSHYRHAEHTGEQLCRFYTAQDQPAKEVRQLLREVRTGLDGLADHSDEATRVINDLARAAGAGAGDSDRAGSQRLWPRVMRMGQWVEWEPRRGEISRGRLSWISPFSGNYLFVGPFGRRMLELPPAALIQALEDGRMRLTDAAGITEPQATRALLERMQALAAESESSKS